MPVKRKGLLLLAALLLLLSLWKCLCPARAEALRARVEAALFPELRETVEAWGRQFSDENGLVAALGPGGAA